MKLEQRMTSAAVSIDADKKIRGRAIVYNSRSQDLGGFTEIIAPGAFDEDVRAGKDVVALFNHDHNQLLGRTASGTLKLTAGAEGVDYAIDPADTQLTRDLMALMQRGDITGSSFGFYCIDDEWGTGGDGSVLRTVKRGQLVDVSPVVDPAYLASSVSVRTLFPQGIPESVAERMKKSDGDPHKTVDGEVLRADAFLIVGDAKDPETWHLPWKFSTDEKTKSHLRDALARFDQVKGVDKDELAAAHERLVGLCKKHGIDVSDKETKSREREQMEAWIAFEASL